MRESGLLQRDQRTLMIGAAVVTILLGVTRGRPAAMAWERTRRNEAAAMSREIAEVRLGRSQLSRWRDSAKKNEARLVALDSVLLNGPTPGATAAELASIVGDLADDARVRISTMQLRADTVVGGSLALVAVRVSAAGDVYGLMALLRSIESDDALLLVRDLTVSQPEPTGLPGKIEVLRFELLVEAVARIAAAKPE